MKTERVRRYVIINGVHILSKGTCNYFRHQALLPALTLMESK